MYSWDRVKVARSVARVILELGVFRARAWL